MKETKEEKYCAKITKETANEGNIILYGSTLRRKWMRRGILGSNYAFPEYQRKIITFSKERKTCLISIVPNTILYQKKMSKNIYGEEKNTKN